MKVSERFILAFDWLWLLALLCLIGAGLIVIQSTTDGTGLNSYFGRQLIAICAGFLIFMAVLYVAHSESGLCAISSVILISGTSETGHIAIPCPQLSPSSSPFSTRPQT